MGANKMEAKDILKKFEEQADCLNELWRSL